MTNTSYAFSNHHLDCDGWKSTEEHLFALTGSPIPKDNDPPMQVRYALFADYALISVDNKVSLIGLFDEVNAPTLPFQLGQVFIAVGIQAEPADDRTCHLEILLWDQDGNPLFTRSTQVHFSTPTQVGGVARHSEIMGVGGLLFAQAGDHSLIVKINGEERTRVVLKVNAPPAPA